MRKKRKEVADVSAASSSPPTPPKQASTASQHWCLFCEHAPAKKLRDAAFDCELVVFCSQRCAAAYALSDIFASKLEWCEKHDDWTDFKGRCIKCKLEREGYPGNLLSNPAAAQGEEKAVQP